MSGAVPMLQGLCIFPKDIQYDSANGTLTRITEAWLVGEGAADGPASVHLNGLWIGLGLRGQHHSLEVGFGTRDGNIPTTWTTPRGTADVTQALKKAFGANTANWKGFHLQLSDLPPTGPNGPTWDALFLKVVSHFQPNKPRDFHVVPLVVALAGGTEDMFGDVHYLLGLSVFTQSSGIVEDFMVVTHAMLYRDGRPAVTIPPRAAVSPQAPKDRPQGNRTRVPPRAKRPASKPSKSRPKPRSKSRPKPKRRKAR